jgi:hypothetical protein
LPAVDMEGQDEGHLDNVQEAEHLWLMDYYRVSQKEGFGRSN